MLWVKVLSKLFSLLDPKPPTKNDHEWIVYPSRQLTSFDTGWTARCSICNYELHRVTKNKKIYWVPYLRDLSCWHNFEMKSCHQVQCESIMDEALR